MTKILTAVFAILISAALLLSINTKSVVNALDLVEISTIEDYNRFALGDEYHAALIYFYANWDRETIHLKKVFQEAADQMTHDHVSGLVMGLVDVGRHPQIARSTGVKGLPALLLYQFGTIPRRFAGAYHESAFTVESIIEFAVAEAHLHREKLSKIREAHEEKERTHYDFPHPNPGFVIDLNARNFNRVVRDPTKTAFVMYYADWCDICKSTMPYVVQLADYFKLDKRVVIARMDVDANEEWLDANGPSLEGVPTFYLYPRGRKDKEKGWHYLGDRELEAMQIFVNANNRKGEEDIDEFHRNLLKNKPDDHQLPEYMRGHKVDIEKDAMPSEIYGEDGRPHGHDDFTHNHPMNSIADRRSQSMKTKAERQFEADTAGMTDEEKEAYRIRKMRQNKKIERGGNPMGLSGHLPPEMRGKLD